jgi:type IV pilus assembly protein PilF
LRKAITSDNRFGPAYNIYGLIYMELTEDKLAEENFRRAIELDRSDSEARNNYGWFLCTRGRHDEGLEQFAVALRNPLYPQPERAMANAGLCAEMKGDLALAEANLLKSLKLQPDNPNTVLKLAGLNFRQGRLMETQRLLGRHAELAPPTAESLWLGVRLERKLGDRAQEAAYGLQLRKRFPDSNEARLLLAGQYE